MPQPRGMRDCAFLQAPICRDRIEERIIRAYVLLALTPSRTGNTQMISVAQFGTLEVRLTELPSSDRHPPAPPFWVEMFDQMSNSVIHRCGCFEFDEDELNTAIDLILEVCANRTVAN